MPDDNAPAQPQDPFPPAFPEVADAPQPTVKPKPKKRSMEDRVAALEVASGIRYDADDEG